MRVEAYLALIIAFSQACRSTRATVDIMDANDPPKAPNDDYPHVVHSVQTSVKISAISLPTQNRNYERLDLSIRDSSTSEEKFRTKNYKVGDVVPIEAHQKYEIILGAWMGGSEMFSTRFCTQRQAFVAEEGVNSFTASLCTKP